MYAVWATLSHTVRECCKGDEASQWRNPTFDPPPRPNPVSDRNTNRHEWLRHGHLHLCNSSSRSAQAFHFCACATLRTKNAKIWNESDLDSNSDFRINLDPDVHRISVPKLWIHSSMSFISPNWRSPLARACQVWSTSVSAFVSYPVYRMTEQIKEWKTTIT